MPLPGIPAEAVERPDVPSETPPPRPPTRRLAPRWLAVKRTPGPSLMLLRMRSAIIRSLLAKAKLPEPRVLAASAGPRQAATTGRPSQAYQTRSAHHRGV